MKNFVSSKVLNLQPSATVSISDKARKLRQAGFDIINLAGGEPDFDTPRKVVDEAVKSINIGYTHYVDSKGIIDLRKKIAEKLYSENNIEIDYENGIIVTASAKYALFLALFTFINIGDEVLVFDPSWVSYKPLIEMSGGVPVPVPLNYKSNFAITEESLLKYVTPKTKALILNSPNNPTGRVVSRDEMSAIVSFIQRHDILLISDEIYEKIIFDSNKHISPGSFSKIKDKVITVNGFSKAFAMTGWRLGYLAAHPELIKEVLKVQQHTLTCAGSFIQQAAVHAFSCEKEVMDMTEEYSRRRDFFVKVLNEIHGVECRYPQGAFYVFPNIDYKGMDSIELCSYIIENAKVAATPGSAFGAGGDKCIRMSFATEMENLEKAVERLSKIF
ncbi:MAG TPA: pyridoxal phosphate-dependent aminotransferase [Clostridia bacterium]|nr:pyridoxal phosphate-dependent aminotransferase [Clostridia bacterium]